MSEMTGETWQVIDDSGTTYEVAVEAGRGEAPSWWAQGADGVARRSHDSARAAAVLLAQACGWSIAEVVAPGQKTRAAEVAHLEDRRGALLAEVDRLTAALATARADGAREMRERAAKACEAVMDAQPRSSLGDVAMCCRADVLSLPLPGEEVARG